MARVIDISEYGMFKKDGVSLSEFERVEKLKMSNRSNVKKTIAKTIEAKKTLFMESQNERSVCFLGHSQLDMWHIEKILDYEIRNCGVSGITAIEYRKDILEKELLNCNSDVFFILQGTNDIVWNCPLNDIVDNIVFSIDYVRKRNEIATIIVVGCLHTRGRVDRSNARIDELNNMLKNKMDSSIVWLGTGFMDDKTGELNAFYTEDGLHLNDLGYKQLEKELKNVLRDKNL